MTPERYQDIDKNNLDLTAEEMSEGWHFCPEWDYLLTTFDGMECDGNCLPWTEEEIQSVRIKEMGN